MKKHITILLIFTFSLLSGQSNKLKATKTSFRLLEAEKFIGQDVYGYQYSVNNNTLHKIKGKEKFVYKNFLLGQITKVIIENPLRIMLFYENFNTIILLDNQLNEIQKINFSENPTPIIVTATGIAVQNQLWVFNRLNQQIGLFDYLKNNYKTISNPFTGTIKQSQSDFNNFYWIDDKNNWFMCSIYGKISNLGTVPDYDSIQIINNEEFIYSKNNVLFFENIKKNERYEIENLEKTIVNFYYKDQILSIFTSKEIVNYKIITP
jgi:hypothetical protein